MERCASLSPKDFVAFLPRGSVSKQRRRRAGVVLDGRPRQRDHTVVVMTSILIF